MTNEECEQLITEITEKFQLGAQALHNPEHLVYITLAEKIIKRFALKPPFVTRSDNKVQLRVIDGEIHPNTCIIEVYLNENSFQGLTLNSDQLKQHIEHCTKMLKYLEHE